MSFKFLTHLTISHFLLAGFAYGNTTHKENQEIVLSYSINLILDNEKQLIEETEIQAYNDASLKCEGRIRKNSEHLEFYHGPWNYRMLTLTFKFECHSNSF